MKYLHNISRIEAFSDAVFAFAATLMVLNFDLNENIVLVDSTAVNFISFGVSFFVLVGLWWLHYNFFRRTDYVDAWIVALNAILLFVVLYYVFPLKSLINSMIGMQRLTLEEISSLFQLYSLGFLLIFSCLSSMYYRAYRKTRLSNKNFDLLFYTRHFAIYIAVSLISIVLAKSQIGIKWALPGMIYTLLGPLCYFHGVHFAKKYQTNEI